MYPLFLLVSFVFGTIVGSFLNVLVLRYGTGAALGVRSRCPSCGKTLQWFELVPLISFILQRGRCRSCRDRISWQYPLVELLTGLVFVSVFWKHGLLSSDFSLFSYSVIQLSVMCLELLLWSLLVALSVYDLRHKIIPNGFVYPAVLAAFLLLFLRDGFMALDAWGSAVLAAPFAGLWLFSRGRLIGLGDAKLLLLFSPFLGFAQGLSALLLGFWLGALVALAGLLLKAVAEALPAAVVESKIATGHSHERRSWLPQFPAFDFLKSKAGNDTLKSRLKGLTMKTELPLAPFLVTGLFIVYLTGIDVTGLGMFLAE